MTLTEQWKKGELKRSWYYVLTDTGEEYVTFIDGNWIVDDRLVSYEVKEVLAPVPSYEEWQELSNQRNQLIRDIKDLAYIQEENQQIKELLKECRKVLNKAKGDTVWYPVEIDQTLTKIDNAIGENR